ncbi:hypothetical protein [Cohnella cholangitidis]|uniref:Uncharacterized protein n=1 Tax=Cohnella cholangitidis TaxID=2598458 RepID=A0A7G5C5Q0_9BACL|nr:hypothetical protein [Cohnella cholangitidis]QMV44534.1 hypothetical protein FPL14_27710 [Cohnella cholangitidis]
MEPIPSEYSVDLVFIRPESEMPIPYPDLEDHMKALFKRPHSCFVERRREDRLEIATVQINGLSAAWAEEREVIAHMEERMPIEHLECLSGYRVQVIPKEHHGTCALRKRG